MVHLPVSSELLVIEKVFGLKSLCQVLNKLEVWDKVFVLSKKEIISEKLGLNIKFKQSIIYCFHAPFCLELKHDILHLF